MNKKRALLTATLAVALTSSLTPPVMAAFTLNGTRYIYEEGKKSIPVQVTNNAKVTYGGQVWIDNSSAGTSDVFMVPVPTVFKVDAGKKQVVRLMNVNPALPADRESLFWLNVQELPPAPGESDGAIMALAMNTKVKLIYRPKALADGRLEAEKKLTVLRQGTVWLKNPTPYWFAVTGLQVNGKSVAIPRAKQEGLIMLAPFSQADTGLSADGRVIVRAVNDWGGVQDYEIQ